MIDSNKTAFYPGSDMRRVCFMKVSHSIKPVRLIMVGILAMVELRIIITD